MLADIVQSTKRVAEIIGETARTAEAQGISISGVAAAARRMEDISQTNAAQAEELAATAANVSDRSQEIVALVSRFDVGDEDRRAASTSAESSLDAHRRCRSARSRVSTLRGDLALFVT